MNAPRLEVLPALPAPLVEAVLRLAEAAIEQDGVRPLSEHVILRLRHDGEDRDRHLVLLDGDDVVGYAHLDPTAELVVHPAHRGRGLGRRLVTAAMAEVPDDRFRLWAHGDHPAARALASSLGLREGRRLEQWRRPLSSPLPPVELPDGVTLRTFRPGQDDEAWLEVNARAFADHPEQGRWTVKDLRARMHESWFDPQGFLLADADGRIAGFHWTKVHDGEGTLRRDPEPKTDPEPIGEVYVVGVDPTWQGRRLGRALTIAGLAWLQASGLPQAMLYVESDNTPAKATYRSLGFTPWSTDVLYYRGSGAASGAVRGNRGVGS